ncbi:MAG: cation transporter, partial [Chloroflexi bacterium]|nr:cation transporter [Chloroflexota bacterium]
MIVKDPVCGMEIDPKNAFAAREHMGQKFYFCSADCVGKFDADPHHYAMAGSATTGFNPEIPLAQLVLPILGMNKDGETTSIAARLQAIPGISQAIVNRAAGAVQVTYDPKVVTLSKVAEAVRSSGFQIGGAQTRIGIENLRCASCVGFIEEELKTTPGVVNASVNVATQEASIEYLPEKTKLADLNTAIEAWGYKTRPAVSAEPQDKQQAGRDKEYQRLMSHFWLAAIISLPVMATAYSKFVPFVRDWSMETLRLAWGVTGLLTLPVMFWSGIDFFTGAWAALKHRSANMNTLIALGTTAAWLYSTI